MRRHITLMAIATVFVVIWYSLAFNLLNALMPLFHFLWKHFDYHIGTVSVGRRLSEIGALILIPLVIAGLFYLSSRVLKTSPSNSAKTAMWISWLVLSMAFLIFRIFA